MTVVDLIDTGMSFNSTMMHTSSDEASSTELMCNENDDANNIYEIEEETNTVGVEESDIELIESDNDNGTEGPTWHNVDETHPGAEEITDCTLQDKIDSLNPFIEILSKEFETAEAAENAYRQYARFVGFGVRRHNKRWNVNGKLTGRKWVCSRQGWREKKYLQKAVTIREPRPLTRTGCKAEFRVSIKADSQTWVCSNFMADHNHELTPQQHVQFIPSHRRVSSPELAEASTLHKVGVTASQIHEFMVERLGGYNNIQYMKKDLQNRLERKRRRLLKETDAETCLSYLAGMKSSDPSYFYEYTVGVDNKLGDLFWCDGGARADYALFGDVIAFDATYRTNVYRKPFVVIIGINHHRRTTVFGFALLADETENTYIWLLETLLRAMDRKRPTTVITDGDRAMRNAITKIFPHAVHRLCCWHLARNAQTNINSKDFTKDFQSCMLQPYSKDRFESQWILMVEKHGVSNNEWVKKMYDDKHLWAEAYVRGHFFGGMRSTQRSEGMNAYLNHYVSRKLRLIEFVRQMDRLMDRQRVAEIKDDFDSSNGVPVLVTHLKTIEKQAALIYTRAMYRLLKTEIQKECSLTTVQLIVNNDSKNFKVRTFGLKPKEFTAVLNLESKRITCTCLYLETSGIPCCHAISIMKSENMTAIPESMIWKRWTKAVKIGVQVSMGNNRDAQLLSGQARVGSLHAACRALHRFAKNSAEAYNTAMADIHGLTMKLQAMCDTANGNTPAEIRGNGTVVGDPVVVLTKGGTKKQKMAASQQRKCRLCGTSGHNARKCKHKGKTTTSSTDGDAYCENLVSMNNDIDAMGECIRPQERTNTDKNNLNSLLSISQNQLGVMPWGSSSDPWTHYLSTDSDSSDHHPL